MKKLSLIISGMALALVMAVGSAHAQTVDFWFAQAGDPNGTPITEIYAFSGETFNLSVWYKTDVPWDHQGWQTMLGFDRARSMGLYAESLDHKLELNGTALTAVTNINPNFSYRLQQALAGGRAPSDYNLNGDRPYGLSLAYRTEASGSTRQQTTPAKLYDVSLVSNMMWGESYDITLWNSPVAGTLYTCLLAGGQSVYLRDGAKLTVNPVPEPSSLLALGAGLVGMAGFVLKKRA